MHRILAGLGLQLRIVHPFPSVDDYKDCSFEGCAGV